MNNKSLNYEAPQVEFVDLDVEGVLCASGGNEGIDWGTGNE